MSPTRTRHRTTGWSSTGIRTGAPLLAFSAGLVLALSGCSAGLTAPAAADQPYTPAIGGSGPAVLSTPETSTASGSSGVVPSGVTPSQAPVTGVTAPTATLGGSTPRPSSTAAPLASADSVRSEFGSARSVHLRFDVVSLTRQAKLVQLAVRITNREAVPTVPNQDPLYLSWNVSGLSDTSRSDQLVPHSGIGIAYSRTSLIDVAGEKRYLVAVDSRGTCLCTPDLYQAVQPRSGAEPRSQRDLRGAADHDHEGHCRRPGDRELRRCPDQLTPRCSRPPSPRVCCRSP